jgi:Co/Zn/Cd efflux system component
MAGCCESGCAPRGTVSPRFRRALWIALVVNAVMFAVEIVGGLKAGSVSLLADAVDFAGDAFVKGATMVAFGLFVIGKTVWAAFSGIPPAAFTMGAIAVLALAANAGVAVLLYAFRDGDADMRSVWLCSRNDAIGNVAVLLAAVGVFGTGSRWPDLAVATVIAGLAISAGLTVMRHANYELANLSS